MSTFDGKVSEFPDIRIDYFRASAPDEKPPLAYFLSHVHSDHLVGLESCKSPFIYCSPGTRDVLLRLEKYPHRMNFAKGILESRKQTYRHLKNLLKAIPLETPTVIELAPGNEIRVTLFDANHCVGAVMFLIEGNRKAILYTGDIRSELWWVDSLIRNPVLLPYACSRGGDSIKKLDGMYLDTTFVAMGREDPYQEFPTKADGIGELLEKVAQYPDDTLFYFDARTFGYEDVWQALSMFLGARIHVDEYRWGIYRALANGIEPKAPEAVKMTGFRCGNHDQEGCLTRGKSRVHSCERGTGCEIWNKDFVRITPIISRHDGVEMVEAGAGGGHGDLNQQHELEVFDNALVAQLMALCATKLQSQPQLLSSVLQMLSSALSDCTQTIDLEDFNLIADNSTSQTAEQDEDMDLDELPLDKLVPALARLVTKAKHTKQSGRPQSRSATRDDGLPKQITFPYSRHASYRELCYLVEAFKPANLVPCTVDEKNWSEASSMSALFGELYGTPPTFEHDEMMMKEKGLRIAQPGQAIRPASSGSNSSYFTPAEADWKQDADLQREARMAALRREEDEKLRTGRQRDKTRTNPVVKAAMQAAIDCGRSPVTNTVTNHIRRGSHDLPTPRATSVQRRTPERRRSRERGARVPQGDFWPPQGVVDHYSPASDRQKSRNEYPRSSIAPERPEVDPKTVLSPIVNDIQPQEHSSLRDRWLKRIAETSTQDDTENQPPTKKTARPGQWSDYGRLTPPTASAFAHQASTNDLFAEGAREQRITQIFDASRPGFETISSTPSRLAARQEAFNALRGDDGAEWSSIGLVSVNGHQVKEEEL